MQPEIKTIADKKLIGMSSKMTLINDATWQLFRRFMPRKKEISHQKDINVFDVKVYPNQFFETFEPTNEYTKWAAVEVSEVKDIPDQMALFELKGGEYAVFKYKGLSANKEIFMYIFTEWLPQSDYQLDNRPHFDILGKNTKLNDPNSEEEIWIPIKLK